MVFGWGKKKKEEQRPVEEKPLVKEIHLSDIPQIIKELEELRKSQVISEIKHLRNITEPLIEDLIKIGSVLEKDDLKIDDIDKHLAIIVVRGKKQVIDVIKKGIAPLPQISTFEDAVKLNSSLNQTLKKVGDVLGRQTRVIHIFAKKYASQLKDSLVTMNSNHSEIRKLLKNYDSTQSLSTEILDVLNTIDTSNKTLLSNKSKIDEISNNLTSIDEKISSFESSVSKIKSSENYKKYLDLKNTIQSFSSQKLKIKNEIDTQFTKISRPLSRYEYGSSLDKEQKNLLSELIKNPFDVIVPQNLDSIIIILENVRKGITSGSISVKDVEKSLTQITETEESLEGFSKRIQEYFDKHKKMSTKLSTLQSKELSDCESSIEKNTNLKNDLETKLKTIKKENSEINLEIPNHIYEIEKKLRQFSNTRYSVLHES